MLLVVYLILGGLARLEAALIIVQTWEHGRFARARLGQIHRYGSAGRVMLTVPCRGTDVGFQRNLDTLFHQDYDDYQVRFVVESTNDPAYQVISRLIDTHPEIEAEIVVAGKTQRSGQKVHNLLAATRQFARERHVFGVRRFGRAASPRMAPRLDCQT